MENETPWNDLEERIDILAMQLSNGSVGYMDGSNALWDLVKPFLDSSKM